MKDTVLDDVWWERVDLSIKIMEPLISLLPCADTDQPILADVYEGWDSMIESMRSIVMENECPEYETSTKNLWSTIQDILISVWDKNYTPLHCGPLLEPQVLQSRMAQWCPHTESLLT